MATPLPPSNRAITESPRRTMLSFSSPPLLLPTVAAAPPRAAAVLSPRASSAAAFAPSDASPCPCTPPPSPPSPHRVLRRHGMPPACSSLYEVLGIPVGATCQEIKVAYRRLARSCHPDAAAAAAVDRKGASADEFMRIHAAYSTLSDPEKRAVYDSSLFRRRSRPLTVVASGGGGYRGRNWETDQCW